MTPQRGHEGEAYGVWKASSKRVPRVRHTGLAFQWSRRRNAAGSMTSNAIAPVAVLMSVVTQLVFDRSTISTNSRLITMPHAVQWIGAGSIDNSRKPKLQAFSRDSR